jgi:hypothetical protein
MLSVLIVRLIVPVVPVFVGTTLPALVAATVT